MLNNYFVAALFALSSPLQARPSLASFPDGKDSYHLGYYLCVRQLTCQFGGSDDNKSKNHEV
jgi:hypothetical protein